MTGMNLSAPALRLAAAFVLVAFAAFTLDLLRQFGYMGFVEVASANGVAVQVFTDLVIALTFVLAWVIIDARREGGSYWPVIFVTLLFGSLGPLLYLVVRPLKANVQRAVVLGALAVLGATAALNWAAVAPSPLDL